MFKSKMLVLFIAPLILFCIIGASARSCVSIVPQTGQTETYADGDDGDFLKGMPWPIPRFTDNGNGTVTDNLTMLIWLKNASCEDAKTWPDALAFCNNLASGSYGLSDDSVAGDWRLPNVRELLSLVHYGAYGPALPNTAGTGQWEEGDPFSNVVNGFYWTSTTVAGHADLVWNVGLINGGVKNVEKTLTRCVWPVRDGE